VSDVIGSYIIGTFWLIILILLYQAALFRRSGRLEERRSSKPPVSGPSEE
jgi:membrane-associated phospholipid phosphatase